MIIILIVLLKIITSQFLHFDQHLNFSQVIPLCHYRKISSKFIEAKNLTK
jgi:hypothetical protein